MAIEFDPDKSAENFRKHGIALSERGENIRVISARKASPAEAKTYDEKRIRLYQR
jgi:uncharacterized DUF497 family protein